MRLPLIGCLPTWPTEILPFFGEEMLGDGQWHIPPAPNDLVTITATRKSYLQNGEQKRGHLGNVYFHCRVECVRAMQAAFLPFLVVIPSGLRPHLLPAHRQHLAQELQMLV